MKFFIGVLLGSLLAPQMDATSSSAALSPVSRVVELLKSLSAQIEKEGAKEEDLYETFVCWGKSVIEQKTASNAAATTRIEMLETYIADLEAGRIELTTERADLEKEIEELMGDMEVAKATRTKEHADFKDAEAEMNQAITALDDAIEVLHEATKDHKEGALIAMRARLNGGMTALAQQQAALSHAVDLGSRFLNKADSSFLRRLLLGDVPTVDWKKLNRKATFKMAYKARSTKIQDVLSKLHQTFSKNLQDATEKEDAAQETYDKLTQSKQGQLDAAREALLKMAKENGAAGMSNEDAKDEVDALKKQVSEDTNFIMDTQLSLEEKKKQWKTRQELRTGELAAMSKAIEILHNDDARDLLKRSMASQGFLFLQTSTATKSRAANSAAAALREAAQRSGDQRLLALASGLASVDPDSVKVEFGPVLAAIDKMIAMLEGEENKDLEIKETCEDDRMSDTRKSIILSREIDEDTQHVNKLVADIKALNEEIAKLLAEHKKVEEALAAATKIREDENAAWKMTDKDDEAAATTVLEATAVIQNFYKENDLMFVQRLHQPAVEAGKAPPPPPPTWDGGYGGKTGEATGIVGILDMIHKDILKDQADAKAEEDQAQKEFTKFKDESEQQMEDLMDDKNGREKTKGEKEGELEDVKSTRATTKGELNGLLEKIAKISPNCEYFEVNYPLRVKNRQIEIDGLQKAKAILEGGSFTEGPDPNREIKPGDAAAANLLQANHH